MWESNLASAPAFYVEDTTAYFGWVFWEKFTSAKRRKLWGSVVRNEKGDWAIQISPTKTTTIYVNEKLKTEMDIERQGRSNPWVGQASSPVNTGQDSPDKVGTTYPWVT